MPILRSLLLIVAIFVAAASPSVAGSLQVSTVTVDVTAPTAAATMTLRNTGNAPINAQLRIFKWIQTGGVEQLIATNEVAASPPMASLKPGGAFTVRIVRTSRAPVVKEESYRLLIDELPDASTARAQGVKFTVRHSLPVFFGQIDRGTPSIAWSGEVSNGMFLLKARNAGNRRIRLASLKIATEAGEAVISREGLVGYVLGQSEMAWSFPLAKTRALAGRAALQTMSDGGPINASIAVAETD